MLARCKVSLNRRELQLLQERGSDVAGTLKLLPRLKYHTIPGLPFKFFRNRIRVSSARRWKFHEGSRDPPPLLNPRVNLSRREFKDGPYTRQQPAKLAIPLEDCDLDTLGTFPRAAPA